MEQSTDYDAGHPLHGIPAEVLQAARGVLTEAVAWKDVDADQAEPLADAVVMALLPWLDTTRVIPPVEKEE
jgi:hypothetical protein